MSDNSILSDMVSSADKQVESADKSVEQLNSQIDDLKEKQNAIKTQVGDVVSAQLESYLSSLYDGVLKKDYTFNDITDSTSSGTLTMWEFCENILDNEKIPDSFTYMDGSNFSVPGDLSSLNDQYLVIGNHSDSTGYINIIFPVGNVVVIYDPILDITNITMSEEVLWPEVSVIFISRYLYNNPIDTNIDSYIEKWNFAHDYIIHPLGLTGTYGTKPMIENLENAKSMILLNKTKIADSKTVFGEFITA